MAILNTFFSAAAAILFYLSLNMQRESLMLQTDELKLTREELTKQAEAQTKSHQALELQNHQSLLQKNYDDLKISISALKSFTHQSWKGSEQKKTGMELFYVMNNIIRGGTSHVVAYFSDDDFRSKLRILFFKLSAIEVAFKTKELAIEDRYILHIDLFEAIQLFIESNTLSSYRSFTEKGDVPMDIAMTMNRIAEGVAYFQTDYEITRKHIQAHEIL